MPSPSLDVLVVAAFLPELAPLRALLGEALQAQVGARRVAARPVGIGLPQAAVGAALQIVEARPALVVLVGTCGAYATSTLRIGDAVVARKVLLVEPAAVDGAVELPEPMSRSTESDPGLRAALAAAGALEADVATTLGVTVDDAVAARVALATGAGAEHMESHGVATACASAGVPFAAVLGVANMVGSAARAQWREHHRAASAAAIDVVTRWLGSLP